MRSARPALRPAGARARALAFCAALLTLALGLGPGAALAQATCEPGALPARSWNPPLDRAISLHAGTVSLQDALRHVTNAARLRLSYSPDLLPLTRRTCLEFERAPLGAVLERILSGTTTAAVVAGSDHVVLASTRASAAVAAAEPLPEVVVLDGITVAAHAAAADRPAGVAGTSIDGRVLERQGASSLADALDGFVPGVWVWPRGSGSPLAQYGSVRGASSFGLSAPKLYIDGLEVANPLLVSSLDPATIERIEVLRGPQGAALFGADAAAGVTHIITRHGALDAAGSRALLRTGVGVAGSAFTPSDALEQEHGLSLFAGSPARSARLDLAFNSLGEYVPNGATSRLAAVGSTRLVSDRIALTATARFLSERSTLTDSPLLQATSSLPITGERHELAVGQYTAGITAAFRPGDVWTHTLVAGINGYTLAGAPSLTEATSAADSALAAAGSSAFRTTIRLTSTARLPLGSGSDAGLTFAAEHSSLHQDGGIAVAPWWAALNPGPAHRTPMLRPSYHAAPRQPEASAASPADAVARERGSTGLSGRLDAGLGGRVSVSTGLRLEQVTLENGLGAGAALPSLGASWTALARGQTTLVLRAAFGRGVRWPQAPSNLGYARQLQLLPEVQSGTEAGIDLAVGRALSLQATRFDQTATGLTQQVAVSRDSTTLYPAATVLVAQNVGTIANRGWELAAVSQYGPLTLSGTVSLVDSRVRHLATGYHGDLLAGDPMLGVPARTASISALWAAPRWTASLSLSRASDWIGYDRIALARVQADSLPLGTADLREYWLHYPGTTRLRASFSRDLGSRFSLRLIGDNLLDIQTGDPDNTTIIPGRTISFTLRARL